MVNHHPMKRSLATLQYHSYPQDAALPGHLTGPALAEDLRKRFNTANYLAAPVAEMIGSAMGGADSIGCRHRPGEGEEGRAAQRFGGRGRAGKHVVNGGSVSSVMPFSLNTLS